MRKPGNLFFYFLLVTLIVLVAVNYNSYTRETMAKNTKSHPSDSIIKENGQLKKMLSEKLVSLCDTMTPDQKIRLAELDEFASKLYKAREADGLKAYKEKENTSMAAYKEKESKDMKSFIRYQKANKEALLDLEKNDPQNFLRYATISFKEDKYYDFYEESEPIRQEKEKIEKTPLVAKYVAMEKTLSKIRDAEANIFSVYYDQANAKLEKDYNFKLQAIDLYYKGLLEKKKMELGL